MSLSYPVAGRSAKINRADENIENLEREASIFLKAKFSRDHLVVEFNVERTECTVRATTIGDIDNRFSVLVGEIIHHLRSSLDHLMWALITRRAANPTWRPLFPIFSKPPNPKAARNAIGKGVSDKTFAILESLQPYRRKEPKDDPLAVLHDLDIIDKHRLLLVVFGVIAHPSLIEVSTKGRITDTVFAPPTLIRPANDRTEICRVSHLPPDAKVDVQFSQVTPEIAFAEFGPRKLEPIIPGLRHLRQAALDALELFRGEF